MKTLLSKPVTYLALTVILNACSNQEDNSDIHSNVVFTDTLQASGQSTEKVQINNTVQKNSSNSKSLDYISFTDPVVQLLEAEIVFDSDFNPSVIAKIKNNTSIEIIAVELLIDAAGVIKDGVWQENFYNKSCKIIKIKSKISIKINKTGVINERIQKTDNGRCKLDFAVISFGELVFANGKKYDLRSVLGVEAVLNDLRRSKKNATSP